MMATESPQVIDRSNEATVTAETEPTIKIDSDPQNVDSDQVHVNGDGASSATDEIDNKAISDIIDDLVNSAEVSISGGSDNEASRSSKLKDDDKGHERTSSSVKKLTSFKTVSVNKTFLAAKGATSNAPAKTNDKPTVTPGLAPASGTASLSAARPRLVAKSGSGLVAKSASGINGGKQSAPDPNAVWNKNRPVPPPEPKKFTDEELKKYGIHMASRLQSDATDTKGHANWADIDDDDDDGDYLETITWKDGTKITIPHVEEQAPTPAAPAQVAPPPTPNRLPEPVQHVPPRETFSAEKPKSPAPGPPPVRTLPSGKGLVLLKGAPEKPTLVAKPPAPPMPAKSPWAPIPRVDKASSIVAELPASQQGGPRFLGRDASAPRGTTPPPTKEIAVDDFHRSPWRDGPGAPNRELFNSHSGRYEPVQDRRGSAMRNDQQYSRQPHAGAVLQRAVVHETLGPAEPSSAFQTSRVSEQHVPYGRRRGSSNVSGGSGQYLRLKGYEQQPLAPPELLGVRRESFGAVSDSLVSPIRNFSPSSQLHGQRPHPHNNQNWQPQISPASSHSIPHHQQQIQSHPSAVAEMNSPVPSQSVPSQPAAPAVAPVVTEQDYALQKRLMQERRELAMKRRLEQEAKEEAERKERIRLKLEAMGPAPDSRSAKQAAKKDDSGSAAQNQQTQEPATQALKIPIEVQKQEQLQPSPLTAKATTKPDTLPNAAPPAQEQPVVLSSNDHVDSRGQPQGHPHGHPHPSWPHSTPQAEQQRYGSSSSWNARQSLTSAPNNMNNVWGSPNNDRSLGNGTFNPDLLSRIPDAPLAGPIGKHVPGPIAPPSTSRGVRQQANASAVPSAKPAPIGPPTRQLPFQRTDHTTRTVAANAWTTAVQAKDAAMNREMMARREVQDQELRAQGLNHEDVQAPIKDTWRPTKLDDDGRRNKEKAQQAYHATKAPGWGGKPSEEPISPIERQPAGSYAHLPQAAIPSVDPSSGSILGAPTTAAPQLMKSSRFFPNSRDVRQEAQTVTEHQHRSSSPSPPPPDMAGHPAFDGDVARPQVHLPPAKPRVCLPPAPAPVAEPKQPAFGWANPAPYKEPDAATTQPTARAGRRTSVHDKGDKWQTMFDNLLHDGRKPMSPPKPSVPVVSASRSSLEHPQYSQSATVSLPLVARGLFKNLPADNGSTFTKDMAEDCFEEQEMGSVPPVRLPKHAPESAWHPCPAPKPMPRKFWVMPSSADMLTFTPDMTGGGTVIRLFVPGMSATKNITVPFSRTRSNPRRPRGGRNASQPHRGSKGRDSSTSYSNDHMSTPSSPAPGPRGRGGYRGGREYAPRHQGQTPIST